MKLIWDDFKNKRSEKFTDKDALIDFVWVAEKLQMRINNVDYVNKHQLVIDLDFLDAKKSLFDETCMHDDMQIVKKLYEEIKQKLVDKLLSENATARDALHLIQFLKIKRIKLNENYRVDPELKFGEGPDLTDRWGCYIWSDETIYLYPEEIRDFVSKNGGLFKNYLNPLEAMYRKVLTHEFGHIIFSYLDFIKSDEQLIMREKQANYFSSYILDGEYDKLIEKITQQYQPRQYLDPYLVSNINDLTINNKISLLYYGKLFMEINDKECEVNQGIDSALEYLANDVAEDLENNHHYYILSNISFNRFDCSFPTYCRLNGFSCMVWTMAEIFNSEGILDYYAAKNNSSNFDDDSRIFSYTFVSTQNTQSIWDCFKTIECCAFVNIENNLDIELPDTINRIEDDIFLNCTSNAVNLISKSPYVKKYKKLFKL